MFATEMKEIAANKRAHNQQEEKREEPAKGGQAWQLPNISTFIQLQSRDDKF